MGNVYVCGKKASVLSSANYNQTFVLKYDSNGNLLWSKEFNATTTETTKQAVGGGNDNNIYFASTEGTAVKLRKLSGVNGAVQWTKTINNSELNGIIDTGVDKILATSTGMKAYNAAGTLLWSNNFIVKTVQYHPDLNIAQQPIPSVVSVATNVSLTEPQSNFLVQIDAPTGAVLYQKNLSFGSHPEYTGDIIGIDGDGGTEIYILASVIDQPYNPLLTKLAPCSEFTFSFSASVNAGDVTNLGCNNGEISVNLSGTFNSWAHLQTDPGTDVGVTVDLPPGETTYTFSNLPAGNYTVKVFDESCGEQDTTVTVSCAAPSGLSTTNITRNKARLNWALPTCNAGVQLQYRLQSAPAWTTVNVTASYKQLTGLAPNSLYEWKAATKCGTGIPAVYSDFSAAQTFSTLSQRLAGEEISAAEDFNESLVLYPNPETHEITVQSSDFNVLGVEIYNVLGEKVYNKQVSALNAEANIVIDVSKLPQGIYYVKATTAETFGVRRFVKE